MIEMSRAVSLEARVRRSGGALVFAFMLAALGLSAALAGCCGSGPTHKCDFTPPNTPHDAGAGDGGVPCGQEAPCSATQVCCVTRVPLNATCIDQDPVKFMQLGCESVALSCLGPSQCPSGWVCCFANTPQLQTLACGPSQLCTTSDNMHFLVCTTDADCPGQASGSCQLLTQISDGTNLSICH
jgi:hypothetical protein